MKLLRYSVRPKALAKYLGLISLILASLVMAPLLVSLGFGEFELSKRYLIVILLLMIVGLPSLRLPHPSDIQHNESLAISALAFIFTPLIMSYPMMAAGLDFIDAWFEAVSAVTTTGLSTVSNIEEMPKTFLFARAWMQWYGGLGIVILSLAIVINHHITLRRIMNPEGENMTTTTRTYAHRILAVYLALTLGGAALLMILLDNSFHAVVYTLAAVSTGGFSPLSSSLSELPSHTQISIMLLSLSGAIPLILYYRLMRGWREAYSDIEARTLLAATLVLSLLLALSLKFTQEMDWSTSLTHGSLLGISAQTATGFTTLDIKNLAPISLGLMIAAMIIGGCVGSTAGGFKILRLIILLKFIQFIIQRSSMPAHAVADPRLANRALSGHEIERALLLIVLFIIVIGVSWLIFLAYGYPPFPALFEVISATATAGLSSGIISQGLEEPLKIVLCIDMLMGRLEIIALLVVLYPGTWLGKRME